MSLFNIQQELEVPKAQHNSHGNYYYRSCEDILDAVKPFLKEYSCMLHIEDSVEVHGDRVYIVATVSFTDDCGVVTKTKGYAREPLNKKGMDESQITGAASSYARKYALNAMFLIDDVKDADAQPGDQQKKQQENKKQPVERELLSNEVQAKWNGKIYKDGVVYIDNEPVKPPQEQIKKLRTHEKYKESNQQNQQS